MSNDVIALSGLLLGVFASGYAVGLLVYVLRRFSDYL